MKKLFTVPCLLLPCVLASFGANADEVKYDQLHKQLSIMDKIIKSSVGHSGNRKSIKISGIESTYLKKQGVVFTINTSGRFGGWGSYKFNYAAPAAPVAPISPADFAELGEAIQEIEIIEDMNLGETVAHAMESASHGYEVAIESLRHSRELIRDLSEEKRDLEYELRDVERESRDIEFQLRRADKAEKEQLKAEVKQLEKKKKELLESKEAIVARSKEYSKKQSVEANKREQARTDFFGSLSEELAETFCLYGNGLKSLPKGEYVTVILKSGGERIERGYKDKIHVFSKRDINGCATDKISAKKLLEKSNAYQF